MSHTHLATNLKRAAKVAITLFAFAAAASPVWASRSSDLQDEISRLSSLAGQYESQASQAQSNGDNGTACTYYRKAANAWRDAASAGTSLIIETLNDSNLDGDAVNENVHIMANNAGVDDQSAEAVCN